MHPIVLIAPNEELANNAKQAVKQHKIPMDIRIGMMQDGVEIAKACLQDAEPPKILLSRGGTALLLRSQLKIPVVEIKISLPDAINALIAAREYGDKIMFLGFSNHIQGVKSLRALLDLDIDEVSIEDWHRAEDIIKQAKVDGFHAIIGGALQQTVAAEVGIPFVFLNTGPVAVYHAYEQAKSLLHALLVEERKAQEIRTILDDTRDGFLAIDKAGHITLANQSALTMIGLPSEALLGTNIAESIPSLAGLTNALSGNHGKGDIVFIGDHSVLFQQTPLKHQNKIVGAMATLKSTSSVKKDESRIRQKQYEDGLYTNYKFEDIVGGSQALASAKQLAHQFAKADSTVLIVSESGTGKEMFAQSIHNSSLRREGPFVAINCASLSSSILESELFGYVGGAFTGAKRGGKAGVFEVANNGTIFLDEIGELPLDIQGKLLRVLQERCVMRLGDTKIIPVDIRVIAATNRNLVEDVRNKKFRQDLFFRLDVLRLSIPPLRERREDIPMLCELFMKRYGKKQPLELESRTLEALSLYSWPGNIRELENIIERLCIVPPADAHETVLRHISDMEQLIAAPVRKEPLHEQSVREALNRCNGNKRKAAEYLGVHRSTLYRFLDEHEL